MVDQNERNRLLAEEFRAGAGQVAEENFKGAALLLLTTKGRKSGTSYTTPMRYLPDGDRFIVFASHQGAEKDPDWCKNLIASGEATVEVGTDCFEATAQVLEGDERDELYRRQVALHPVFGEYEKRTTRRIPVIALRKAATA